MASSVLDLASVAPNLPLPGEVFAEKYRVERVLGVGGMGYVVAATHLHLHERVALKMLLPNVASDPTIVERFLREGRAAVKIRSEHVARVLDVAMLPDGTPYLVMEYLDGMDFSEVLADRGPLPHALAVDWVLQAAEAIAEAHALSIVHRDLKPANLFLATLPDGVETVKVLDFGISKTMSAAGSDLAMTRTASILGSPLYMSPEQLKNARDVDGRSDIWSLGVILYELTTGAPPFAADSIAELGSVVLAGNTPWLGDAAEVPEGLSRAVATCLQLDKQKRFVDLADFADAIAPFGTDAARGSAKRIVARLGMPAVRAERAATPVKKAESSAMTRSHAGVTLPGARPARTASLAVVVVLALAAVGIGGLVVGRTRGTTQVPTSATSAVATVPAAEPTPTPTTTSKPELPPSAALAEPPPSAHTAAPPVHPHPTTLVTAKPASSATIAPPETKPPPAASSSAPKNAVPIATSSKD